jgi:hypothetical protein
MKKSAPNVRRADKTAERGTQNRDRQSLAEQLFR